MDSVDGMSLEFVVNAVPTNMDQLLLPTQTNMSVPSVADSNDTIFNGTWNSSSEKGISGQLLTMSISPTASIYELLSNNDDLIFQSIDSLNMSATPADFVSRSQGGIGSLPMSVKITVAAIMVVVAIATVLGNALVIWAILTQRSLKLVQNHLLISLASADMTLAIIILPFTIVHDMVGHWIFGYIVCNLWRVIDVMCCTASILNLCVIALDRFWAITSPIKYAGKRTKRRMVFMIIVAWSMSFLVSLPQLIFFYDEGLGEDGQACNLINDKLYRVYSAVGSFFAPFAVMSVLYLRIYKVASFRLRAKVKKTSCALAAPSILVSESPYGATTNSNDGQNLAANGKGAYYDEMRTNLAVTDGSLRSPHAALSPSPSQNTLRRASCVSDDGSDSKTKGILKSKTKHHALKICLAKERRAANTLGIIMGLFTLCWLPFFVMYVYYPFCSSCDEPNPYIFALLTWLGYINSVCNPIIYTVFNREFRNAFKKIWKNPRRYCHCRC